MVKDDYELEMQALDAQIALQLKQAQSGFWKVGLATAIAGATLGGFIVSLL